MRTWVGEGIYWRHVFSENSIHARLRTLGTPTLIVAQIDLSAPRKILVFPGLVFSFVAAALGLVGRDSVVHFFDSIPANGIERIIQPGDPDYPDNPELPHA